MGQKILMIEDDRDIMKINHSVLLRQGYSVLEAESLEEGRALLQRERVDLILLDIMLPDGSGLAFCREVREKCCIPILFLTALGESGDIVEGLTLGGDDYLSKPYDLEVLAARVEALLRRAGPKAGAVMIRGTLVLDPVSQRALVKGEDILLTQRQFAILLYLMRNEGYEVPAKQLYEAAWGQPMANDANALRVAVSRLREKIRPAGFWIASMRGAGYRFEEGDG